MRSRLPRDEVLAFLQTIKTAPHIEVMHVDEALDAAAWDLLQSCLDKSLSQKSVLWYNRDMSNATESQKPAPTIWRVPDNMKKATATVERPDPQEEKQHLGADKGYDYPETREEMAERGYQVHIPQRGLDTPTPEPGDPERHPARRWVVERTHSWFNRFRKLLIRWEKKVEHWLGLIQFAACLIVYRRAFWGIGS